METRVIEHDQWRTVAGDTGTDEVAIHSWLCLCTHRLQIVWWQIGGKVLEILLKEGAVIIFGCTHLIRWVYCIADDFFTARLDFGQAHGAITINARQVDRILYFLLVLLFPGGLLNLLSAQADSESSVQVMTRGQQMATLSELKLRCWLPCTNSGGSMDAIPASTRLEGGLLTCKYIVNSFCCINRPPLCWWALKPLGNYFAVSFTTPSVRYLPLGKIRSCHGEWLIYETTDGWEFLTRI